jgi:hypothetical protein
VEVIIPTPTNVKIVCAINEAGEEYVSSDIIAVSECKIARKKEYFFRPQ